VEAIEHFVENDGSQELFLRPKCLGLWLYVKKALKRGWKNSFSTKKPAFFKASGKPPPSMDVSHFPGRSPARFSFAWMKPLGLVLLGAAGATYLLRK